MARKLTPRQKKIVSHLRSRGLSVRVYSRASGNRSGVSVHDPRNDMQRKGKKKNVASVKKVRRYPQAHDTLAQHKAKKKLVKRALKSKKRVRKKSPYHALFNP